MEFLDNSTPRLGLDNTHAFIIELKSTKKAKIVEVNGYGDIAANE